jgi:hypothetical protein
MPQDKPSMNPAVRKLELCGLWMWTVEVFSLILILVLWSYPRTLTVGGLTFWWRSMFDASIPVFASLSITVLLAWKRHKAHSVFGLALIVLWLIWRLLPRL